MTVKDDVEEAKGSIEDLIECYLHILPLYKNSEKLHLYMTKFLADPSITCRLKAANAILKICSKRPALFRQVCDIKLIDPFTFVYTPLLLSSFLSSLS